MKPVMTPTKDAATDSDKRARIARVVGFLCLGLAALNVTFGILAAVADQNVHKAAPGIAVATSLFTIGIVCQIRAKRRSPPDA